jgi:hypothetical protein
MNSQTSEYDGTEAYKFAEKHLCRLEAKDWTVSFEDTQTGELWLMEFPQSYMHGGGPPRLRKVTAIQAALHTELWTSWASLLRSYAAAHGLNATQHAVVEVSAETITLRVGTHWVTFTETEMLQSDEAPQSFQLTEQGTVRIAAGAEEEMDFAAEHIARELLHHPQ